MASISTAIGDRLSITETEMLIAIEGTSSEVTLASVEIKDRIDSLEKLICSQFGQTNSQSLSPVSRPCLRSESVT
ncbi:hypothetical protein IMZ48_44840 [Candidatus Bathyarchaeota archaeon]|nr:hypothetical protein [Candidatus Bathyarchaeota archaeon]